MKIHTTKRRLRIDQHNDQTYIVILRDEWDAEDQIITNAHQFVWTTDGWHEYGGYDAFPPTIPIITVPLPKFSDQQMSFLQRVIEKVVQ